MRYLQFKNDLKRFPLVDVNSLLGGTANPQAIRNQLTYWRKRGLILKIRRGLYILNEADRTMTPSRFYVANQILAPSYVSLESALSFYDILPERVADVVSVTTKKTARFSTPLGLFRYHHLHQEAVAEIPLVRDENGLPVMIAGPEQALLELIYFHKHEIKKQGMNAWMESFRIQKDYPFRRTKIRRLASSFRDALLEKMSVELISELWGARK